MTIQLYNSTRFETPCGQKLYYRQYGRGDWRVVHYDPEMPTGLKFSAVGQIYKTKTELLCDLDRYASQFGF